MNRDKRIKTFQKIFKQVFFGLKLRKRKPMEGIPKGEVHLLNWKLNLN